MAAVVLVVAAIAAIMLVARFTDGGDGSLSTTDWAASVCASLAGWRSSITALADVGGGALTPESLREKLTVADGATEQLVAELRDLGPPDLEDGAEVEQALDDAARGLQASYQTLKAGAQAAADADTTTAFLQALAALAPDFQRLLDQIADTTAALQSGSLFGQSAAELERAFSEAESCQALSEES